MKRCALEGLSSCVTKTKPSLPSRRDFGSRGTKTHANPRNARFNANTIICELISKIVSVSAGMDHYQEEPSEITHWVDPDPFQGVVTNYTRMYVTQGKKLLKLVKHAMQQFGPNQPVIWSAEGRHTSKAVECAEIMKSRCEFKEIFQCTQVGEIRTVEVWHPVDDEGLDPLQVTRSVPIIHILLSVDPLQETLTGTGSGYQVHHRNFQPKNIYESTILERPDTPPPENPPRPTTPSTPGPGAPGISPSSPIPIPRARTLSSSL